MSGNGYTSNFEYGPGGQYWKQTAGYSNGTETTLYIGGLIERVTNGGLTSWRHQIKAAGRTVAVYSRASTGATNTIYPLIDHLGSTEAITDSAGAVLVRESFTAFGARRGSNWQGQPSSADMTAIGDATRRGFTAHTMLDNIGLVHMNGRVYDPALGRFLSADPYIQFADDTQSFNRYSYVMNNPLSFTDPSGYFLRGLFRAIKKVWKAIRPLVAIALAIAIPQLAVFAQHAFLGAVVAGATAGFVATGTLRGAALGAFSAAVFYGAGSFVQANRIGSIGQAVTHAVAGCVSAVVAASRCATGAISAGFANFAGAKLPKLDTSFGNAVAHGLLGGVSSRLGGGDFGDGFKNGVFGYAFNCSLHPGTCTKAEIDQKVAQCRGGKCYREAVLDYEEAGLLGQPSMSRSLKDFLKIGTLPRLLTPFGRAFDLLADASESVVSRSAAESNAAGFVMGVAATRAFKPLGIEAAVRIGAVTGEYFGYTYGSTMRPGQPNQ